MLRRGEAQRWERRGGTASASEGGRQPCGSCMIHAVCKSGGAGEPTADTARHTRWTLPQNIQIVYSQPQTLCALSMEQLCTFRGYASTAKAQLVCHPQPLQLSYFYFLCAVPKKTGTGNHLFCTTHTKHTRHRYVDATYITRESFTKNRLTKHRLCRQTSPQRAQYPYPAYVVRVLDSSRARALALRYIRRTAWDGQQGGANQRHVAEAYPGTRIPSYRAEKGWPKTSEEATGTIRLVVYKYNSA